ncbi:hypothetical protein ACKFKG_20295 [Phormidesmis sp. 146-35]
MPDEVDIYTVGWEKVEESVSCANIYSKKIKRWAAGDVDRTVDSCDGILCVRDG